MTVIIILTVGVYIVYHSNLCYRVVVATEIIITILINFTTTVDAFFTGGGVGRGGGKRSKRGINGWKDGVVVS